MKFFRENWAWIVVPVILFATVVITLVVLGGDPLEQNGYDIR